LSGPDLPPRHRAKRNPSVGTEGVRARAELKDGERYESAAKTKTTERAVGGRGMRELSKVWARGQRTKGAGAKVCKKLPTIPEQRESCRELKKNG